MELGKNGIFSESVEKRGFYSGYLIYLVKDLHRLSIS
jgi:hypothetical protein